MRSSSAADAQPLYRNPASSRYSMVNSDTGSDAMSFSPRNSRQNSSHDLYADGGLVRPDCQLSAREGVGATREDPVADANPAVPWSISPCRPALSRALQISALAPGGRRTTTGCTTQTSQTGSRCVSSLSQSSYSRANLVCPGPIAQLLLDSRHLELPDSRRPSRRHHHALVRLTCPPRQEIER